MQPWSQTAWRNVATHAFVPLCMEFMLDRHNWTSQLTTFAMLGLSWRWDHDRKFSYMGNLSETPTPLMFCLFFLTQAVKAVMFSQLFTVPVYFWNVGICFVLVERQRLDYQWENQHLWRMNGPWRSEGSRTLAWVQYFKIPQSIGGTNSLTQRNTGEFWCV